MKPLSVHVKAWQSRRAKHTWYLASTSAAIVGYALPMCGAARHSCLGVKAVMRLRPQNETWYGEPRTSIDIVQWRRDGKGLSRAV